MAPRNSQRPLLGVWTEQSSRDFYRSIQVLGSQLRSGQSPQKPKDYRNVATPKSTGYLLSFEEELLLADHFAFIAHAVDDNKYVSAATIEEGKDTTSYTVRIASNRTLKQTVQDRLARIIEIVKKHAETGRDREEFKTRLFHEIVVLSQQRIYGRIRTTQWSGPRQKCAARKPSLHHMIGRELAAIRTSKLPASEAIKILCSDLVHLRDALERVDKGTPQDQLSLLKEALIKSHRVSNHGGYKSLENRLKHIGFGVDISGSAQVQKIEKLSKYWQCCEDFIHFSRDPKTRPFCKNLKLEICQAPPSRKPVGSEESCFVHGEVQLALYYEQHPSKLPPQALGSSKSACCLCDLFIAHHGKLRMSHSHMRLYSKWTIPQCESFSQEQCQRLRSIIVSVMKDIRQFQVMRSQYYFNSNAESMAHLPRFLRSEDMAPSELSSVLQLQEIVNPVIQIQSGSEGSSSTACLTSVIDHAVTKDIHRPTSITDLPNTEAIHHGLVDLPIQLAIFPLTKSCTVFNATVEYYFDLEDIECGKLCISDLIFEESSEERKGVNVEDCKVDSTICVRAEPDSRNLVFYILNTLTSGLRVDVIWGSMSDA
ncbi:hypothetical protein GLAREA_01900 [Glarea lozoyensis ATCC 20868]|uniref:Uncharacterized protein n=1 Tax=Glarea lozoyensis (strain ATCC 20868 / MF5171) TaxID=1116229 RepID=S3DHC9_GLAL2|nr:uncharacterized protein GLAREA_01900 [Glarea lozoyensis ATCC 20868]EPE25988.1 hypothetical protein GLAREA_01900 [Glarea lozoyensis ATCC 20868]